MLIDHDADNDDFLAVGIASFANYETCTEGVNHASAYMKVAGYLDFIDEHTSLIVDWRSLIIQKESFLCDQTCTKLLLVNKTLV